MVIVDDKIKSNLDRKEHISYVKDKNENELQRSAEKLRTSQSPNKSYKH